MRAAGGVARMQTSAAVLRAPSPMFKLDTPPAPPMHAPPHDERGHGSAAPDRGWHTSSFDLAQGLVVVEAADDEVLSLFGTLQPQ